MRQKHRVEVLRHERDATWESWSNPDRSVRVQRRIDGPRWGIEVDGRPVMELDRQARDGQISITGTPLAAASLKELALRVSLQRRLHLVFDA